jgi:acetate---CoA ligase (ADP-forming)
MRRTSLEALRQVLIGPRSVAVVGASADPFKTSGRPTQFLKQHGFDGHIWPINPNRSDVQGLPAFPDLRALPGVPDHAYIVLDADPALEALEEAVKLGVPLVSLLAGGFAEAGAVGARREARLREIVKGSATRILGPNCLGVVRPATGFVLSANAAFAVGSVPSGQISVISQSGSAIGTFVSRGRARGIGFANLVSVGNEADLSVGMVGQALVDERETEVFILFLESLKHAPDLEAFAEAAHRLGKSVLVYKLGRSSLGAQLAVSHTGAIVSDDDAANAFFRDLGFHRITVFEALFEGAPLFTQRHALPRASSKPSVAIVTTTGGGGALVADQLGVNGVAVAAPSESVRRRIGATGIEIGDGPLIDLTLAGTKPIAMRAAIEAVLEDSGCDAVTVAVGSSAEHFPELAVKPIVDAVAERRGGLKPLAVFTVPEATRALTLLGGANIAAFRTPEACADAVTQRLKPTARHPKREAGFKQSAIVAAWLDKLPSRLTERHAISLFERAGVTVAAHSFISLECDESLDAVLKALSFPVVAKVVSPDLPHKSEYGGVRMNLASFEAVRDAIADICRTVSLRAPSAKIEGFLVQEKRSGVLEAILGLRRDPAVGPVVSIGVGGIFAELHASVSLRRAPVDVEEAVQMISEVRGFEIAQGYRGRPKGDIASLAAAIAAFSQLGAYSSIMEAEINPLIIGLKGEGVWAVDGLLVTTIAQTRIGNA